MADASDDDVCAICLGGMVRGQASFTAECSHAFHLSCISASVQHGNHNCPLCKALWTVLPAVNGPRAPPPSSSQQAPRRTYADDEPVQEIVQDEADAAANGAMVLKTHCEFPAVARGSSRDNFAVLVHLKAPSAASEAARAPLDLVTVLDVSWSMNGAKLALLKQAMRFVIDNLGSADRLSVVSFSDNARRLIHLGRMSDEGKAAAKRVVESLSAISGTNIGDGLRVAAQVLDDRRYKNAVTSIMLLSDGQDNYTQGRSYNGRNGGANYINLVPSSLKYTGFGARPPAVHAFGFGTDHDAAAMHTIAEVTAGTFSFIENQAVLQDSFAQCLGGLLTVAVQEARIAMTCLHPGVRIREVKSGRYDNRVDAGGRAASVDAGELYADEERRFLILVDVPALAEDSDDEVTGLVKLSCNYRDAATGQAVNVAGDDAVVQRPVEVTDVEPSVEVERERLRVAATEDMAAAREAADRGEHAEGARILRGRLLCSAPRMAEIRMSSMVDELNDLIPRVEESEEYEATGRACFLSGMSSHRQQRAGASMLQRNVLFSAQRKRRSTQLESKRKNQGRGMQLESIGKSLGTQLESRKSIDLYEEDLGDFEEGACGENDDDEDCEDDDSEGERQPQTYVTPAMTKMLTMSRLERKKTAGVPPQQEKKNKKKRANGQQPGDQSEPPKRHKKH